MSGKMSPRQLRHAEARAEYLYHHRTDIIVGKNTSDDVPVVEVRVSASDGLGMKIAGQIEELVREVAKAHGGRTR